MGFLAALFPVAAEGAAAAGTAAAATAGSLASTLSTVGLAASAIGSVVSAIGGITSAGAQGRAAGYQAQVAANNEQLAKTNAQVAGAAGEQQFETEGLRTRATVGAIKASQAASNIDVNSGSAVDVQSSAAELGELNSLTTRANVQRQVYGYETQAGSFRGQAGLARAEEAQAPIAGDISAAGSLLSGASAVGNQYAKWQLAAGGPAVGATAPPKAIF